MSTVSPAEKRHISLLHPDPNPNRHNGVQTSKYTALNFIPKNLLEQFSQVANAYFLIIAVLQTFKSISNTGGVPMTLVPLSIVVFASGVKDFFEDRKRAEADKRENEGVVAVIPRLNSITVREEDQPTEWQRLRPGMVVRINEGERFPADLLLLSSSEVGSGCSVETMNLDGESNLKQKSAALSADDWNQLVEASSGEASDPVLQLECEPPTDDMYCFRGAVTLPATGVRRGVDIGNLLLRGTSMQHTQWAIGLVVYCGHETRIMLNSQASRFKLSQLDIEISKVVAMIFACQMTLCLVMSILATTWQRSHDEQTWYLGFQHGAGLESNLFYLLVVRWGTWLLQMNNLVPISLVITITGVKYVQGNFIGWDQTMVDCKRGQRPAEVHTSQVIESLGLVTHVFSDKTGTLTQNSMVYKACAVDGQIYGLGNDNFARMGAREEFPNRASALSICSRQSIWSFSRRQSESAGVGLHVDFKDKGFRAALLTERGDALAAFLLCHALCHTVMPTDDACMYNASSPDELALVCAARSLGLEFLRRGETDMELRVNSSSLGDVLKRVCGWTGGSGMLTAGILAVCEFDNDRKRMSVVAKYPDGSVVLLVKGADASILSHVQPTQDASKMEEALNTFANKGLRTLCLGYRRLDPAEFEEWSARYQAAQSTVSDDRAAQVAKLAIELETCKPITLLGATAIEDLLQDQVPETIEHVRAAGVTLWVLTGDKLETAVSIGFSSRILTDDMVNSIVASFIPEDFDSELEAAESAAKSASEAGTGKKEAALTITGAALGVALASPARRRQLFEVASGCKVVIACRVSPKQKADVVNLVREHDKESVTLSIGDGANDVSMIVAAHIGVGISGKEGAQAARSADFAISEFRLLRRLMFVHGRESYRKNSTLALYTFYKTQLLTLLPVFYAAASAYSGQPIYEPLLAQGYNVLYTQVPIMLFGIFDRAVDDLNDLERCSKGYAPKLFSVPIVAIWGIAALLQCRSMVFIADGCLADGRSNTGVEMGDMWTSGTVIFFWVVLNVNLTMAWRFSSWYWFTPVALICSVGSFVSSVDMCSRGGRKKSPIVGIFDGLFAGDGFTRLFYATVLAAVCHAFIGEPLFRNAPWIGGLVGRSIADPSEQPVAQQLHEQPQSRVSKTPLLETHGGNRASAMTHYKRRSWEPQTPKLPEEGNSVAIEMAARATSV